MSRHISGNQRVQASPLLGDGDEEKTQGADWLNYKRLFVAAFTAANPDERRTRGPRSLVEAVTDHLRALFRHSPRRSNPCFITESRQAAVVINSFVSAECVLAGANRVQRSGGHGETLAPRQHGPAHPGVLGGDGHDGAPVGVDPTVVSPAATSITATPAGHSCPSRTGHMG